MLFEQSTAITAETPPITEAQQPGVTGIKPPNTPSSLTDNKWNNLSNLRAKIPQQPDATRVAKEPPAVIPHDAEADRIQRLFAALAQQTHRAESLLTLTKESQQEPQVERPPRYSIKALHAAIQVGRQACLLANPEMVNASGYPFHNVHQLVYVQDLLARVPVPRKESEVAFYRDHLFAAIAELIAAGPNTENTNKYAHLRRAVQATSPGASIRDTWRRQAAAECAQDEYSGMPANWFEQYEQYLTAIGEQLPDSTPQDDGDRAELSRR